MNVRSKIILLVAALFTLLGFAQAVVQQRILLPSFTDLERQNAKVDMDRVAHSLRRQLDELAISARDWGNWADTYKFMRDRSPAYVKANLYPDAIHALKVDVLALLDTDGRLVWSSAFAPGTGQPVNLDLFSAGALPPSHPWRPAIRSATPVTGLIATNHGALLAVLSPILDGNGGGVSRGGVLLGRLLSDEEVARIGAQAFTALSLSALRLPGRPLPSFLPGGSAAGGAEAYLERDKVTDVYRVFYDIYGQPLLTLRGEFPRSISARGRAAVSYAGASLFGAGALALVLVFAALNRVVVVPLALIKRHAQSIGGGADLPPPLALAQADEFGTLAQEFDRMIERLKEARRRLADQSYLSGKAEMAGGTLHNIGNALTPLRVKIAGLRDSLRNAPVADVELAATELERPGADPSRRAELQSFLCAASRELARTVKAAEADADLLARQSQAAHQALKQLSHASRADQAVEPVFLPALIERSAEIIPDSARRDLHIRIDQSVHAVGEIRVARIVLQQVFQNLIINAAEAVHSAGRQRGSLQITAQVVPAAGAEPARLCMDFRDDGPGIPPEHIERVFEQGFSTKSKLTNAGIGLHWCANAVRALGGELRASSDGAGRGACFRVLVPVPAPKEIAVGHAA